MTTTRPTTPVKDRIGALCGAAFVLLIFAGNSIAEGGQPEDPTGAQILAHAEDQSDSLAAHLGLAMEALAFVFFAFFLSWLWEALRRNSRAPWLSTAALIGGITTLAVKLGSAAGPLTVMLERKVIDDQTALVLDDLGGAAFVVSFVTFGIFLLATGLAGLESGLLGRVAGWSAVVLGAAGILLTLANRLDPATSNPVPFLLGSLWVLVVSIRLAVRTPEIATAPSPARVTVGG